MRKSPWKIVALVATVHLMLYAVLGDEGWIQKSMESELRAQSSFLGPQRATREQQRASTWFNEALVAPGIVAGSFSTFTPSPNDSKTREPVTNPFFDWFAQRLRVFWTLIYQALSRVAFALTWLPYGGMMVAPAIVDGLVRRRIKQTNFDYASPDKFGFSVLLAQITFVGFFLLLFAPWSMPVLTAPACFLLAAISFRVMLANVQKRI